MKVLNLRCSRQHSFEGWFGSENEFQDQLKRGLVECPLCADIKIQKMPSAPRLNFGAQQARGARDTDSALQGQGRHALPVASAPLKSEGALDVQAERPVSAINAATQAGLMATLREAVSRTEDVGQRFAEEARRMHYGEIEARTIRGQATVREAVDLMEEGIEVMPLPMLSVLKETLQ